MERRKFEDSFKDAFVGAEVSPPDGVWTNIELDLEKADGNKIRRRLIFYKLLAAASVAFALCFAGLGYYMASEKAVNLKEGIAENSSQPSANTSEVQAPLINKEEMTDKTPAPTNSEGTEALTARNRVTEKRADVQQHTESNLLSDRPNRKDREAVKSGIATGKSTAPRNATVEESNNFIADGNHGVTPVVPPALTSEMKSDAGKNTVRSLPSFYTARKPELLFNKSEPDPGMLLLAKLADEEKQYAASDARENEKKSEKLWTSVGFAAGAFSSVNSSVTPTSSNALLTSSNSTVANKQASASGIAYSYAINVGTKLSNRWVLQGGVNYMIQSSDYTATNVVGGNNFSSLKAESINALDNISQSPLTSGSNSLGLLAATVPYTVNNSVKFFSVPVQAGYLVVNKKFGVQLNAGISTDLFLQNTITPEGGSLDKTTQGRGEDSPYRSFNFSGLMGTEFTYRFGQFYRVALNPGLRYPFNSVFKDEIGVQSMPLTFDVGLRFRYIFH